MRGTIFKIILIILVVHINKKVNAQNPVITNITVLNDLGHVQIWWEYSGTENLEIFRDSLEKKDLSSLQVISASVKTFIDYSANAHQKPRLYKLQGLLTSSIQSDIVTTFHLTHEYDSCAQTVSLKWEDRKYLSSGLFTNWIPSQFLINVNENGNITKIPVSASTLEYTIGNISENTGYNMFIETAWQGQDSTSNSNPIIFTSRQPGPSISSVSASANGNNTDIRFEVTSNPGQYSYKLLKSSSASGNYDTLETITTSNLEILATDADSNPNSTISYYKLISINECSNEWTGSDIIHNVVLEAENQEYINTLSWNLFKEHEMASVNYDIYRITNNESPQLIRSFKNFNTFTDNIESLQGTNSGQFCYFIRAYKDGSSSDNYSQSNIACIYLNPQVFVPEAFTPNDDGTNDEFMPVFTFLPSNYEIKIYNRWGNIIFETSDPSKAWNGEGLNGRKVQAGAYIYYLKIKSPESQTIEKRGSITVFYP